MDYTRSSEHAARIRQTAMDLAPETGFSLRSEGMSRRTVAVMEAELEQIWCPRCTSPGENAKIFWKMQAGMPSMLNLIC